MVSETSAQLLMLPGIGADERLFEPQLRHFPAAGAPAWIPPGRGESLRTYARRLTPTLGLGESPFALVGFSFGGQVALEVARHLAERRSAGDDAPLPRAVVLLSACRASGLISASFRRRELWSRALPAWLVRRMMVRLAPRFAERHVLDDHYASLLANMARTADVGFSRSCARATAEWVFTEDDAAIIEGAGVPIRQMHGERDDVIPLAPAHADEVIAGGAHLIVWTHAAEVSGFIERAMETPPRTGG